MPFFSECGSCHRIVLGLTHAVASVCFESRRNAVSWMDLGSQGFHIFTFLAVVLYAMLGSGQQGKSNELMSHQEQEQNVNNHYWDATPDEKCVPRTVF
jgi:hypothetical protein